MKNIRTYYSDGNHAPGWTFRREKCIGLFAHGNDKTHVREPGRQYRWLREMSGWTLTAPDGTERFCEGNWEQFVTFANMVLDNHGLKPVLS